MIRILDTEICNAAKFAALQRIKYLTNAALIAASVATLSGKHATKALESKIAEVLPQQFKDHRISVRRYSEYTKQIYLFVYSNGGHERFEIHIANEDRKIDLEMIRKQMEAYFKERDEIRAALETFDEYAARYNACIEFLAPLREPLYEVLRNVSSQYQNTVRAVRFGE